LRDDAIGLRGADDRGCGLEPAEIAAGGERERYAQQDGRSPKAAAHRSVAPSRKPCHSNYSYLSSQLIPAQQLNLPHPEHFDSRPAARLDPAADSNPPIFERLKHDTGSLDRRHDAP
jgi:hypothetical protein